MRSEEKRNEHPGWAVQLNDGSWLCYAHGFHTDEDAFLARDFGSKSEALAALQEAIDDGYLPKDTKGKAIEAWQPLCENLRHTVKELRSANKVSPDILFDVVFTIENALSQLKVK